MNREENVPTIHLNVMEELVREEIEKQLKSYPPALSHYIDRVEVATYALNRLPPLYASSHKGRNQQRSLAKKLHREQIQIATRQAIAAVQRDPLRSSIPLVSPTEIEHRQAREALQQLRKLFEERLGIYQPLSWQNLAGEVERAVRSASWLPDESDSGEEARIWRVNPNPRSKTATF